MKKSIVKYEYKWKIVCKKHKTQVVWASTFFLAIKDLNTFMKSIGYNDHIATRLGANCYLIKFTKKHQYGIKNKIVYLLKLKDKRVKFETRKFHKNI